MRRPRILTSAAALCVLAGLASSQASVAQTKQPTVVELFQSQGCSDCPPANANVIQLSNRPDLLTLSFGVTYWDQLGWKDTFASPQNTARQWDYAHAFNRQQVFTPEVVVNGRGDVVGSDLNELQRLIAREQRNTDAASVTIASDHVAIGAGNGSAQVWLVRYDPNVVQVAIARGENGGRTLPHKNVVKELVKLGEWTGQPRTYPVPQAVQNGLREAVLVQAGPGGAIIAAAHN
jgi:hypothetical protein